jgi:glycosyltransferase involved in cell wall biosynthesis
MLREALQSVQAQTYSSFECIVVDDAGSRDVSLPDDPRFRLIRNSTNLGASGSWNVALEASKGKWVTWLADDDVMHPHRLEIARPALESGRISVCGMGTLGGSETAAFRGLTGDVRRQILDAFVPSLGATAIARNICPTFDLRFRGCEDVEWWLRAAHVAEVESRPEVGYLVRHHEGVRHGNGARVRASCSELLLEEHRDYFAEHPKAKAFRHQRIAYLYAQVGEYRRAFRHAARALQASPSLRQVSDVGKNVALGVMAR